MTAYTKLVLREVAVSARVGLAPWERERAQRLLVDVELHADPEAYLASVSTRSLIDYRLVYERIQRWQGRAHTEILETLVSDLLDASFEDSQVVACRIWLRKVEALDRASAAGVDVFVTRREYEYRPGGRSRPRVVPRS